MRRRTSGVTLMELLISTIIVVIISGAMTRAFVAGFDFERNSERRRTEEVARLQFEERIRTLLSQAYVTADEADTSTYFIGLVNDGSTSEGSDTLVFTARGGRLPSVVLLSQDEFETNNERFGPQGGVVELAMSTTPVGEAADRTGLFLREQRPSDGDYTQGGVEGVLNAEVTSIRFHFWDGTQWVGEWDTADTSRRIPPVIRVVYRVGEEEEDRNIFVRLPLSDVTLEDPVTYGEGVTQ